MTAAEQQLLTSYRRANPRSRAGSLTPITRNGTRKRVRECLLCHLQHSECGLYSETVHMAEWRERHSNGACVLGFDLLVTQL